MSARRFVLYRREDVSGLSGEGIVAEGVQFSNGKCALSWLGPLTSVVVYDDIEVVRKVHGHDGKTEVRLVDCLEESTSQ